MSAIWYYHRGTEGTVKSRSFSRIFDDWRGVERDGTASSVDVGERWLFVAPHDDDIVIGCGLTAWCASQVGAEVFAAVTTDGKMGYCSEEQRATIGEIRKTETTAAFRILGIPEANLTWLDYPDCSLPLYRGRRFGTDGVTTIGLQDAYTRLLRHCRPNRVFIPSITDLHPDHQVVHREMLICLFHAQGDIWPELGEPLASIPKLYEYACYSDFTQSPDFRIAGTEVLLQKKLDSIGEYRSQAQIELIVKGLREAGPDEYFREYPFRTYEPRRYAAAFENAVEW